MACVSWKILFAFLLTQCVTVIVTIWITKPRIISTNMFSRTALGYNTFIFKPFNNINTTFSTTGDPKSIHGGKDNPRKHAPKSLFVFPQSGTMAFNKSSVSPYFYRLPQSHHPSDKHRTNHNLNSALPDLSTDRNNSKLILFYNLPEWYRRKFIQYCQDGMSMCPIQCTCSKTIDDLGKADAVIVDGVYLRRESPMVKLTSQVWIFFTLESPFLMGEIYKSDPWRQMFNWTMTYRLDSDIHNPYDILLHRSVSKNYTAIAERKNKSAVWLVTNCKTHGKRELFVKELQKYYNVDIFGGCGRRTQLDYATLLSQYRFYLAFENSLCFDYITEKLFRTYASDLNIIPVVRGGADYDAMIPKGTFINTAHFNTPKELGEYLANLEKDVTAYANFLQRNDQFVNEGGKIVFQNSFCDICVKLNNLKLYENWYTNIGEWINDGTCKIPTDV